MCLIFVFSLLNLKVKSSDKWNMGIKQYFTKLLQSYIITAAIILTVNSSFINEELPLSNTDAISKCYESSN